MAAGKHQSRYWQQAAMTAAANGVAQATPQAFGQGQGKQCVCGVGKGGQVQSFQFDCVPSLSSEGGNLRNNCSIADSVIYDRIEILEGATGLLSGAG